MTDRPVVNPPLLWIGALLALFGAIVLAVVLVRGRAPHVEDSLPAIQQEAQTTAPSRVWPLVAGLSLALGAGCIGIGMNRWRAAS
jgi:hypothetical protein